MTLHIQLSDYDIAHSDILGYRGLFFGNEGQNNRKVKLLFPLFYFYALK